MDVVAQCAASLAWAEASKGVVVLDRDRGRCVKFEVKVLKERLALKPRLERYYVASRLASGGDC
ncbi:MAG: hypothetical protein ABWU84_08235 [Pyrobaculum sp.]|uniref:hypothetical protein n=1 Tax=Pyrobaculum sp. TaxID=2004705 RepID=UPI003EEE21F1